MALPVEAALAPGIPLTRPPVSRGRCGSARGIYVCPYKNRRDRRHRRHRKNKTLTTDHTDQTDFADSIKAFGYWPLALSKPKNGEAPVSLKHQR